MDERERFERLKIFLNLLRRNAVPSRFREKLERMVTGAPLWWSALKLMEWRLTKSLDRYGDLSFETKRSHDQWQHVDAAYRYGRLVTPQMQSTLGHYELAGMSDRDLRLLVVNGIFKKDGSSRVSLTKERWIFIVGWLFVALCVLGFLLITALIWSSPMDVAIKLLFTAGSAAIFFVGSYAISCYAIKSFPVIKKLQANNRAS